AAANGIEVGPLDRSPLALARQPDDANEQHPALQDAIGELLVGASYSDLGPEQADELIELLAAYTERRPGDAFLTVINHGDELYGLLAPWGFSGASPVEDPGQGNQHRADELVRSYHAALAAWKADDAKARRARRERSSVGTGVRPVGSAALELQGRQVESEEVAGGGYYGGTRRDGTAQR